VAPHGRDSDAAAMGFDTLIGELRRRGAAMDALLVHALWQQSKK
jgi:hypothetical protein